MAATPLQVYEAIKPKIGEKESQLLLEHIARQTDVSAKDLATKADIRDMATKADIRDMATKADLARLEARLMRWMFIFWIGQFASIVGVLTAILFAFFKP